MNYDINEWGDIIRSSTNDFFGQIAEILPDLLAAILLFIVGVVLANLLAKTVAKGLEYLGVDKLGDNDTVKKALDKISSERNISGIFGRIVYWIIVLITLLVVADVLELTAVSDTLNDLISYLPNVLAAVLVLWLTVVGAQFIRDLVSTGLSQLEGNFSDVIAKITEWTIVLFGSVIALSQLGFDTTILTTNIAVILGGVLLAVALAFGLGSRNVAGSLVAGYFAERELSVGDKVTVGEVKGEIVKIGTVFMTVKTSKGNVVVPNRHIAE
jgi:small-conductance mechanosensitive channel